MADIKQIIDIAKEEGGKFIVLDEKGSPKLAILPFEDYERLRRNHQIALKKDPEQINQEIAEAQAESKKVYYTVPPVTPAVASSEELDTSFNFEEE